MTASMIIDQIIMLKKLLHIKKLLKANIEFLINITSHRTFCKRNYDS